MTATTFDTKRFLAPDAAWRSWSPAAKARLWWRLATDLHPTDPRPEQRPPPGDWLIWLILAGRGWGKTRTGAETMTEWIDAQPGSEWVVAAPTSNDVRATCLEGPSGLVRSLTGDRIANYNRSLMEIELQGGGKVYGISADEPGRFKGKNLSGAWCDEVALWRYDAAWYEGLIPSLRIGETPRIIVTTTPRPTRLLLDLSTRNDGTVHITRGSTFDNKRGLSKTALEELARRYEGTRLGKQELYGELLTDTPGALWTIESIDHVDFFPDLGRLVVSVDPAVTFTSESDETGIIAAGRAADQAYVLEDDSLTAQEAGDPVQAMTRAIQVYRELHADALVIERNNGGDYLPALVHSIDPGVIVSTVVATRGKATRAEPVASLYREGRVHHVGVHQKLEDQMCRWTPEAPTSPDRMDALVWAVTALFPELSAGPPRTLSVRR